MCVSVIRHILPVSRKRVEIVLCFVRKLSLLSIHFGDTVITSAVCLEMLLKCLWLQLTEYICHDLIHFQHNVAACSVN
jgi:hypothetical protein